MAEHPNVEVVRRGYAAFGAADMETLTELIAEDAVWHLGGNNRLSGDYHGRDAIFSLFAEMGTASEGTMQVELHDILANDQHAVALTHVAAGGSSGKSISLRTNDTMHIRDGQVAEFWTFSENDKAWDDYWG